MLRVRNRQVLPVTRLGFEDDLNALKPFHLFAEEHDVHQILHRPQIGQLEQLLKCDLVAVEDRHVNEELLLDVLLGAVFRYVAVVTDAQLVDHKLQDVVLLQRAH